jgi:CheY-like chemotaxis protein
VVRVLYVDDEPDIREVASLSLSLDSELEVRTAASGHEALSQANGWLPDIILLDVMMPELDGLATLGRLRDGEATKNIPVVFITARTQTHEVERFRSLGAAGVIPKPFDPMTLSALVRSFLPLR